jgi:hypothetical protein
MSTSVNGTVHPTRMSFVIDTPDQVSPLPTKTLGRSNPKHFLVNETDFPRYNKLGVFLNPRNPDDRKIKVLINSKTTTAYLSSADIKRMQITFKTNSHSRVQTYNITDLSNPTIMKGDQSRQSNDIEAITYFARLVLGYTTNANSIVNAGSKGSSLSTPASPETSDEELDLDCKRFCLKIPSPEDIRPIPVVITKDGLFIGSKSPQLITTSLTPIRVYRQRTETATRAITIFLNGSRQTGYVNWPILSEQLRFRFMSANNSPESNRISTIRKFHFAKGNTRRPTSEEAATSLITIALNIKIPLGIKPASTHGEEYEAAKRAPSRRASRFVNDQTIDSKSKQVRFEVCPDSTSDSDSEEDFYNSTEMGASTPHAPPEFKCPVYNREGASTKPPVQTRKR